MALLLATPRLCRRDKEPPTQTYVLIAIFQVLQESYMMIPDSKSRLAKVLEEMEGFLGEHASTEGLPADQLEEAKAILAKAGVA